MGNEGDRSEEEEEDKKGKEYKRKGREEEYSIRYNNSNV